MVSSYRDRQKENRRYMIKRQHVAAAIINLGNGGNGGYDIKLSTPPLT